ncbi:MAG TPA: peptidyl-prolyl cis-trans isomerase [Terriglobales bacterium]|jgi:hypothetical protein
MHFRCVAVLSLCSVALGQAAPITPSKPPVKSIAPKAAPASADKSSPPAATTPETLPPEARIIRIDGICETPPAASKTATEKTKPACVTFVTKAQFEAMANALQPGMNTATKRRLADVYPKMLVAANAARKRGVQNDPVYKQLMEYYRLQMLSQVLARSLKDKADKVPEADIEKYYNDNKASFEQASLLRLFVPKEKQVESTEQDAAKKAEEQKASEDAMKKEAEALRPRAVAGEDFDKLQKEAYDMAGLKGTPPSASMGKVSRDQVPVNHKAVLDLKAGEVSEIITEPNGYYIYKVVSKETKALADAREQIKTMLAQKRLQESLDTVQKTGTIVLNEAYFGANTPSIPGMGPPPGAANPAATQPPANNKPPQGPEGQGPKK